MSGTAKRLAEAANHIINPQPIAEEFKTGDKVKVPHKGKMVSGRIIRYDDGGTDKARQSGGGYVVDVGEPASILVPKEKVHKEAVVTEISKATKDAYVVKRGSQLQRMTTGLDKDRNLLTGRQQANAVKGIKRATGVKEEAEQIDEAGVKFSRWNRNADWLKMAETYKKGTPVNIVLKDGNRVSGTLARWAAYDNGSLEKGYIIYVKTPSSVVEVDDVTVKSIQWNNDPKTKISEKAMIIAGMKEDVDQIDELSKKTLGSYVKKAASNIGRRSADAETHDASMGAPGTSESELAKERNKIKQRYKGIGQAVKRLTKEAANPFNPTLGDLLKSKQQAEIDAKIRKMNAADAVERIKEIINSYSHDKQTKAMIIAGMKSIKESAEITEAPYTPANDYEGEMAMTQLKSIMEKASDVLGMMKPEAKMEAWVQSKITLADEHISCVRDYLKHTDGAIQ